MQRKYIYILSAVVVVLAIAAFILWKRKQQKQGVTPTATRPGTLQQKQSRQIEFNRVA